MVKAVKPALSAAASSVNIQKLRSVQGLGDQTEKREDRLVKQKRVRAC